VVQPRDRKCRRCQPDAYCIRYDSMLCSFHRLPKVDQRQQPNAECDGGLPISADTYLSMTTGRSRCEKIFFLYQILPQQTFDLLRKRKKAESQLNSDRGEHVLNEFCSTGFGVPRRRVRTAESCADIKLLLCRLVFAFAFL